MAVSPPINCSAAADARRVSNGTVTGHRSPTAESCATGSWGFPRLAIRSNVFHGCGWLREVDSRPGEGPQHWMNGADTCCSQVAPWPVR